MGLTAPAGGLQCLEVAFHDCLTCHGSRVILATHPPSTRTLPPVTMASGSHSGLAGHKAFWGDRRHTGARGLCAGQVRGSEPHWFVVSANASVVDGTDLRPITSPLAATTSTIPSSWPGLRF